MPLDCPVAQNKWRMWTFQRTRPNFFHCLMLIHTEVGLLKSSFFPNCQDRSLHNLKRENSNVHKIIFEPLDQSSRPWWAAEPSTALWRAQPTQDDPSETNCNKPAEMGNHYVLILGATWRENALPQVCLAVTW